MSSQQKQLIRRRIASVVRHRMGDEPVIALQGPRTVGKSTLLDGLAETFGAAGVIDLDDLATRDAVAADPALFVTDGVVPIFIDEYQHAPIVLDAIKAELNRDLRPGRFVLTGSTRYDALPLAAQSLTGRLHTIDVLPLSQGELDGAHEELIPRLFSDAPAFVKGTGPSTTTREDYIDRILAGGFPIAVSRTPVARGRWFENYVEQTLSRDVMELSKIKQREALPRLLQRLAGQTAEVLNVALAANTVEIDAETAWSYLRLLEAVFLVRRLPAWGKTLRARATSRPKLHILDSGVAGHLLRLTASKLARRDPATLAQFGHLLETFVVGEIHKQTSWLDGIAGCGHWRTHDGDEVDLVIERSDGLIIGVEVKAGSRVPGEEFRSLRKLRDAVGESFALGVVMYLGTRAYNFEDRLYVMPVDALWRG